MCWHPVVHNIQCHALYTSILEACNTEESPATYLNVARWNATPTAAPTLAPATSVTGRHPRKAPAAAAPTSALTCARRALQVDHITF